MSSYVSNLEDVIKSWGNAVAKKYGTSLAGIQMQYDPSAENTSDLPLKFKVTNVHYTGQGDCSDLPGLVITDTTTNGTDLKQTSDFKRTESTTATFTWTMKEAISVGISLEFGVDVPPVASAKTTITANISVSSTQSSTKTTTQSWEIDRSVTVPPRSRVDMTWAIIKKKVQANFACDVVIINNVRVIFSDPVALNGDEPYEHWFVPIDWIFWSMDNMGVQYPSQYSWTHGSAIFKAAGFCSSALGLDTSFDLKQTRLNALTATRQYTQKAVPKRQ